MDINMNREVLVIGKGTAGAAAAEKIIDLGYRVTRVCNPEQVSGTPGDFRVNFIKDGKTESHIFGAIVAAPEYKLEPLNKNYGLKLGENVLTQTEFENFIKSKSRLKQLANGKGFSVAFVSGYGNESRPENLRKILEAAGTVQSMKNCNAYMFVNNVKVGAHGLEKLFTRIRHDGVLCFKPERMPEIRHSSNGFSITFHDPVIRRDIKFLLDYIVVEEEPGPDEKSETLRSILGIDTDCQGFFQSNNVHRFPVMTNRKGIYVAHKEKDAVNIALRIHGLLGRGMVSVDEDQALVDPEKCVLCLTCYRCCPHGAVSWKDNAAVISPVACQGCGICAGECPMDAIQIKNFSDDYLEAGVEKTVVKDKSIVVFCCENSALHAFKKAGEQKDKLPCNLNIIHVPCAGKVDVKLIWQALALGAKGVVIAACHRGNCRSEHGNTYAEWRLNEILKRLDASVINREQVGFINVASNMAGDFAEKINEFVQGL